MDFISWPELGMSAVAVAAVFVAVTGLMMVVATELTEEGSWFAGGTILPAVLLVAAVFLHGAWMLAMTGLASVIALSVPWFLAGQRRAECLRPILAGQLMLLLGGGIVAGLIRIHYLYFVQ
jgi:hypothetical protein